MGKERFARAMRGVEWRSLAGQTLAEQRSVSRGTVGRGSAMHGGRTAESAPCIAECLCMLRLGIVRRCEARNGVARAWYVSVALGSAMHGEAGRRARPVHRRSVRHAGALQGWAAIGAASDALVVHAPAGQCAQRQGYAERGGKSSEACPFPLACLGIPHQGWVRQRSVGLALAWQSRVGRGGRSSEAGPFAEPGWARFARLWQGPGCRSARNGVAVLCRLRQGAASSEARP